MASILLFPSGQLSFDPIEIDWHKAMATYDDRRVIVGLATKFSQLSSAQAKESLEGMDPLALDSFCEAINEAEETFAAFSELFKAAGARLEIIRRGIV
jgi:hypothetical protein